MSDQPAEIPVLEGQTSIEDVLDDDPCCEEGYRKDRHRRKGGPVICRA